MSKHRALRVFAEYLAQQSGHESAAIDELCQAHPDLEASLRQLARERSEATVEEPKVASASDAKLESGKLRNSKLRRAPKAANRYVLLGEVARGGMAVILHVWDTVLERSLAMKVLDTEGLPKDSSEAEEAKARFLAEARIAGQLQHPGVVPIHDLGVDERGRVYFTMPFFEGRNLDEIFDLTRARLEGWSLGRALFVLSKVCEVMAYAHSRGVIHRDLKPANLIAGAFGEIYVVDWGLAKVLGRLESEPETGAELVEAADASIGQTLDGTVAGTPPYMAPEQAQGLTEEISFSADVYALGAMLYRLLAGRAPYAPRRGHMESPEKIVELIRRGPPTPLRRLAPKAPAELVAICEKAMARQPQDRYASVEDLARDLQAYLESRVGGGKRS
jgi:serine/threonine-protein kinase